MPAVVRNKAEASGVAPWLAALADLVAGLERDWSIRVGAAYQDATEAYVARATLADGTPAVLKLMIPRPGEHARREITVLRLVGGQGCVRLLRADEARGALLLERLGRSLSGLALSLQDRLEILVNATEQVWRPAAGCGLPTGADQARKLAGYIAAAWAELGRPCSARAVDHALACAARRLAAHDDERAVLVHGDVHQWNALRDDSGFKRVDPDGLLAEAECDLGVLMREDPLELMTGDPRERSRWLARRCGLDETAIWEWGVIERVSTGLLATQIGLQPVGAQMLAAADHLAR